MFAFSISVHYLCDAFHIYYLFCKTATMYVRIWSRILSVVWQRVCLRLRTMPSNVHSVGLSIRRFAKIIIFGGIYIFHSITCFKNFLMAGTRIHVFSYVGIPECFLTVLSWCYLILFGSAIINYLLSPCLSLSDLCMLLLGRYVSCCC